MRNFIAAAALAFALVFTWAEYRGLDILPGGGNVAPGVVVPGDGLRVLFVRPDGQGDSLPAGRENIPAMGVVRKWLVDHCPGQWRSWPESSDEATHAPEAFQVMLKVPRKEPRWMVIAKGSRVVYSGPWPATADDAVRLLEKHK